MKNDKIIEAYEKALGAYNETYNENVRNFRNCKMFYLGRQWTGREQTEYARNGKKKAFTFNLLFRIVNQLVGQVMNLQPDINLSAKNMIGKKQLDILKDKVRMDAFGTDAQPAYKVAVKNQIAAGWGVIRVALEYESALSSEQCLRILPVEEAENVFFDTCADDPHYITGNFCGEVRFMDKEKFEQKYGKDRLPSGGVYPSDVMEIMQVQDKVPVVDFFKKEYKKSSIYRVSNGKNFIVEVEKNRVDAVIRRYEDMVLQYRLQGFSSLSVEKVRDTQIPCIMHYVIAGDEVLEKSKWPGQFLPYVYVPGYQSTVEGKQITTSFIEPAMDAQKAFNEIVSEIINGSVKSRRGMLAIYASSIGEDEAHQVLEHPSDFPAYLVMNDGSPQPVYFPPDQLPGDFYKQEEVFKNNIYEILGVYPNERGIIPDQVSGKAIDSSIAESNMAFASLFDNFMSAQVAVAKICLDIIPKIYSNERTMHAMTATGAPYTMTVNQYSDNGYKNMLEDAEYNIQIRPVASFQQQKKETLQALQHFMQSDPIRNQALGPLFAKQLQTPISSEIEEILVKLMPPDLKAQLAGQPPPPTPPNPAMQLEKQKLDLQQQELQIKKMKIMSESQMEKVKGHLQYLKMQLEAQEGQNDLLGKVIDAQAEIDKAKLDNLGDTGALNQDFEQHLIDQTKNYDNIIK